VYFLGFKSSLHGHGHAVSLVEDLRRRAAVRVSMVVFNLRDRACIVRGVSTPDSGGKSRRATVEDHVLERCRRVYIRAYSSRRVYMKCLRRASVTIGDDGGFRRACSYLSSCIRTFEFSSSFRILRLRRTTRFRAPPPQAVTSVVRRVLLLRKSIFGRDGVVLTMTTPTIIVTYKKHENNTNDNLYG